MNNKTAKSFRRAWVPLMIVGLIGAMIKAWGENPELILSMAALLFSGGLVIHLNYRYGRLLSWKIWIPAFYLLMFFLFPLGSQLVGNTDFSSLQKVSTAVSIAAFGLLTFGMGSLLYHIVCVRLLPLPKARDFAESWPLKTLKGYRTVWFTLFAGAAAHLVSFRFGYYGLNAVGIPEWPLAGIASTFTVLAATASIVAWVRFFQSNDIEAKRWRILSLMSTVMLVGFSFGANSKWIFVQPYIIILLAQYVGKRQIRLRWIAIIATVYIVIAYPAITLIRATQAPGAERERIIRTFLETATSRELWSIYSENRTAFSAGLDRGLLQTFAAIVSQTGSDVEYMRGATYQLGLEALVPRFIWAGKPPLNIGNFIGQYYGLLGPYDEITNVSASQMGELYMNFGALGVLVGMFIWGWFAAWVDDRLIGAGFSWVAVVCMLGILWQESIVSQTVLPFLKTAAAAFAFLMCVGTIKNVISLKKCIVSQ